MTVDRVVTLTEDEALAVARRIVANRVRDVHDGLRLDWGDLPLLGEGSYERLVEAVEQVGSELLRASNRYDAENDIDSYFLIERAS